MFAALTCRGWMNFWGNILVAKQHFLSNILGAKQDFCSNILGAKQHFCSNILGAKQDFSFLGAKQDFCSNILGAKQHFCSNIFWSELRRQDKRQLIHLHAQNNQGNYSTNVWHDLNSFFFCWFLICSQFLNYCQIKTFTLGAAMRAKVCLSSNDCIRGTWNVRLYRIRKGTTLDTTDTLKLIINFRKFSWLVTFDNAIPTSEAAIQAIGS